MSQVPAAAQPEDPPRLRAADPFVSKAHPSPPPRISTTTFHHLLQHIRHASSDPTSSYFARALFLTQQADPTRSTDPPNKVVLTPAPPIPRIVARGAITPDRRWQPQPQPVRPQESYCIIAIEQESKSGIAVAGDAPAVMACAGPGEPRAAALAQLMRAFGTFQVAEPARRSPRRD